MESREINNRVFRCDNGEMKLMSKFGISLSAPSVDISAQTLRVNNAPLSSLQISDGAITTEKLDPDLLARLPAASDLYKPFTGSFTASPYVWRFPAEDNSRIAFVNPQNAQGALQNNTKRVVVRDGLDVDSITFNNTGEPFRGVTGFDTDAITASTNTGPVRTYLATTGSAGGSRGYMFGQTAPVANVSEEQQRVVITGGLNVDKVAFRGREASGFFTGSYTELRDKPAIDVLQTQVSSLEASVQSLGGVTFDTITSITVLDRGGNPFTEQERLKDVTVVFGTAVASNAFTADKIGVSIFVNGSIIRLRTDVVSNITNLSGDNRTFQFDLDLPNNLGRGSSAYATVTVPPMAGGLQSATGRYYLQSSTNFNFSVPSDNFDLIASSPVLNYPQLTFRFTSPFDLATVNPINILISRDWSVNGDAFYPSNLVTGIIENDDNDSPRILSVTISDIARAGIGIGQFRVSLLAGAVQLANSLGNAARYDTWTVDARPENLLNLSAGYVAAGGFSAPFTSEGVPVPTYAYNDSVIQVAMVFDKDLIAWTAPLSEFVATLQNNLTLATSGGVRGYPSSDWQVMTSPPPEIVYQKQFQFYIDVRKDKSAPTPNYAGGFRVTLGSGVIFGTGTGGEVTTGAETFVEGTPVLRSAPTTRPRCSEVNFPFDNTAWQTNSFAYVAFRYDRPLITEDPATSQYGIVTPGTAGGARLNPIQGTLMTQAVTDSNTNIIYQPALNMRIMRYNLTTAISQLRSSLLLTVRPDATETPVDWYGISMQPTDVQYTSPALNLPVENENYTISVSHSRSPYNTSAHTAPTVTPVDRPNKSSFAITISFNYMVVIGQLDETIQNLFGFRDVETASDTSNKFIVISYAEPYHDLPLLVQYGEHGTDGTGSYVRLIVTPWVRKARGQGRVENFTPPIHSCKFKVVVRGSNFNPVQAPTKTFNNKTVEDIQPYTAQDLIPFGFLEPVADQPVVSAGTSNSRVTSMTVRIPYSRAIADEVTRNMVTMSVSASDLTDSRTVTAPADKFNVTKNEAGELVLTLTDLTSSEWSLPEDGLLKFQVNNFAFADNYSVTNGTFVAYSESTPYQKTVRYYRELDQKVTVTLDSAYPSVTSPYEVQFSVTFARAPGDTFSHNPRNNTTSPISFLNLNWSAEVTESTQTNENLSAYVRFLEATNDNKTFKYSAKLIWSLISTGPKSNWSGELGRVQVWFKWIAPFNVVLSDTVALSDDVRAVIATTAGFGVKQITASPVQGTAATEGRQLPKYYDGEDYRPTYMKIAEYCDDDLPLDSTQSWTFSDRAGELAPFAKDSQLPSSYEWRLAEKEALLAGLRATVRQMAANAGTQDYGDWTFDASGVAQRKLTVTYRAGGHFPRELLLLVPSAFPLNNKYVVQMYMWLPLVVQAHVPAILELSIAHHQHLSNPSGPVLMDIGKVTWDNPGGGVTGLNGVLASSKVVQATDPNQQKFLDDADPDKRCPVIITSANNLIIFTDQRPIEFTVHAEGVPTSFVYR
eukprot:jgi/Mesvir1/15753/Mv03326-RA.1